MHNFGTKFILAQRFIFDPNSNSLLDQHNENEVIRLGSNESRILLMLSERPNEVITRQELHEFVWRDQGFQVDDSSLTQAISTLRKMLKDSTKSPQFVKTVPKRGYQLIAVVEQLQPNSLSDELAEEKELPELPQSEATAMAQELTAAVKVSQPEPETKPAPATTQPTASAAKRPVLFVLLFVALLMPVFTYYSTAPATSEFNTIATVENTEVKTPLSHPDMSKWLPTITQCVEAYLGRHVGDKAPMEVIATGGQNGQIVLNYVHSPEFSSENVTLKLLAIQPDFNQVCNQ